MCTVVLPSILFLWIYVPFTQFSFLPIRNAMRKHGEKTQSALEVSGSMSVSPWAERESDTLGEEGKYQLEEKGGRYRKNLTEQRRRSSTQEDIVMGFRKLSLLQRGSRCNSVLAQLVFVLHPTTAQLCQGQKKGQLQVLTEGSWKLKCRSSRNAFLWKQLRIASSPPGAEPDGSLFPCLLFNFLERK